MNVPFAPTNLTTALADVLYLALIVGVPVALKYLKAHQQALQKWLDARTTVQERAFLGSIAKEAVAYAERFASSAAGKAKMAQAIDYVQAELKRAGISIDLQTITGALQAAYAELKSTGVLAAAGPTLAAVATPAGKA